MKMDLTITKGIDNFNPWSGAVSTWETIQEENKVSDLELLLEDLYPNGIDETKLNDLLWFESDWLYGQLGINGCVECSYCGAINDEEDLEEDELGNKVCPNCEHEI